MPWRWSILPDLLYSLCPPTDQLFLFVAGWGQGLKWMNLTPRQKMSSARTMLSAVAKDRVITQFPQVRLLAQEYLLFTVNRSYPKPKVNQPWVSFSVLNTAVFVGMYACMYLCEYLYTYTHVPLCMWLCVCVYFEWTQLPCCSTAMHIFIPSALPPGCQPLQEHPVPPQGQSCLRREPHRKGWVSEAQYHWHISLFFCVHFIVLIFCVEHCVEKEGGGVKWR